MKDSNQEEVIASGSKVLRLTRDDDARRRLSEFYFAIDGLRGPLTIPRVLSLQPGDGTVPFIRGGRLKKKNKAPEIPKAEQPVVADHSSKLGDQSMRKMPSTFAEYESEGHNWITLATGEFYPDILVDACLLYTPVLELFGQYVRSSESSERLFREIANVSSGWMRIQLCRVFKRYVSPPTPVEMLKKKKEAETIIERFGKEFRPIQKVQAVFSSRPLPDEPLCALLWEYKDRGKKGYDLTERFFELFRSHFIDLPISGPERAGRDILMREVFPEYPNPQRPVDFVIYNEDKSEVLAIGLARYDGDRGGSQEDDRTGGYRDAAQEIFGYTDSIGQRTKIIFLNDGPGLLLGTMWRDYARLEKSWGGRVMITTLRMVPERITRSWLTAREA